MVTMREVVEDAFEEIGVKTAEVPLTGDELQSGIRRCNDMILAWGDLGILVGYNPAIYGDDDLNVESSYIRAIKKNLAVDLAPSYQKQVSAALAAVAASSIEMMIAANSHIGPVAYPDTLPLGSGNVCGDYYLDDRFFSDNKTENF